MRNTDYQNPESAEHLCAKTAPYAESRTPTAEEAWEKSPCRKS